MRKTAQRPSMLSSAMYRNEQWIEMSWQYHRIVCKKAALLLEIKRWEKTLGILPAVQILPFSRSLILWISTNNLWLIFPLHPNETAIYSSQPYIHLRTHKRACTLARTHARAHIHPPTHTHKREKALEVNRAEVTLSSDPGQLISLAYCLFVWFFQLIFPHWLSSPEDASLAAGPC